MAYTEDDLFQDCERIASRFSKLKKHTFLQIWEAISKYLEHQLVNGKACSMVGLGKFSFQIKKTDTGTQGIIEQRTPTFLPSESFIRQYQLRTMKSFISNEIPVVEVNYFLVAQKASTRKEVVTTALKIIYGRIGEIMNTGKTVSINMGIGKLFCDRKILEFHFAKTFKDPIEFRYFEQTASGPKKSSQKDRLIVSSSPLPTPHGIDDRDLDDIGFDVRKNSDGSISNKGGITTPLDDNKSCQSPKSVLTCTTSSAKGNKRRNQSYRFGLLSQKNLPQMQIHNEEFKPEIALESPGHFKKNSSRIAMNNKNIAVGSYLNRSLPELSALHRYQLQQNGSPSHLPLHPTSKRAFKAPLTPSNGFMEVDGTRVLLEKPPSRQESRNHQNLGSSFYNQQSGIQHDDLNKKPPQSPESMSVLANKIGELGIFSPKKGKNHPSTASSSPKHGSEYLAAHATEFANRKPNQTNLDLAMQEACQRYEQNLRKMKEEEEVQKMLEHNQVQYNAEIEMKLRRERYKRLRDNQEFLRRQMEDDQRRKQQESIELKGIKSISNQKNNDFSKNCEVKMISKRLVQNELKRHLDQQVEERRQKEAMEKAYEQDQEWKMIEKAAREYESSVQSMKQKKMETSKMLSQAWDNQMSFKSNFIPTTSLSRFSNSPTLSGRSSSLK